MTTDSVMSAGEHSGRSEAVEQRARATVDPDAEALPGLLASLPSDKPIVMLNLLRFNAIAQYGEEEAGVSGRQAYGRYLEVAQRKVKEVGGALVYGGSVEAALIAPKDEKWDQLLLVRYPSVAAFATMLEMPEYQAAARHRTAALADARLIATVERSG